MRYHLHICLPLTFFISFLAIAAVAAEIRPDDCSQEEQRLRADEAEKCSGMSYIFNPNACFAARKRLDHYASGVCKPGDNGTSAAVGSQAPVKPEAATPSLQSSWGAVLSAETGVSGHVHVSPVKIAEQTTEVELLRREISGLKVQIEQLQAEVDRLRGEK